MGPTVTARTDQTTPRGTFKIFVRPAMKDCEADPGATHRAVSALCHIDALAEEVWQATTNKPGGLRRYRDTLRAKCAELGYAWDVHDIHKHGMLTQRDPVLPNGRRPQVVRVGWSYSDAFSDAFQIGTPDVVLTLRDETTVRALDVIKKCVGWWDDELHRLGWT
jgi:hypothetical protein